MFAALQRLHGFGQRRAGFGPVEKCRVERVCEEFGRGDGDRPQGDADTLDSSSQKGSGQTHHPISSHPAAGLWVQPVVKEVRGQVADESFSTGVTSHLRTTSLTLRHRSSMSAAVRRKSWRGGLSHTLSTSHTLSPSSLISSSPLRCSPPP